LDVIEGVEGVETTGHYIVRWLTGTKCLC
jgi:hypothetical protein